MRQTLQANEPYGVLLDGPPLLLPPFNGWNQYKVSSLKRCRYLHPDEWLIELPGDMLTDLDSARNLPVVGIMLDVNGKDVTAAVFHDYGYRYNPIIINIKVTIKPQRMSRAWWDRVFWILMRLAGKPAWKAWLLYRGVRLGGWVAWRRHRLHDAQASSSV